MESLNLHTLATSLPTAQQNAEKELTNNFKAAALSITTLYRSSRKNSKRAYNAGYAAACQDLLTMIQQGVSLNPSASSHDPEQGGLTIGRVMDWTEARLDAIKSREEEEDEEEEREKEKESGKTRPTTVPVTAPKPDNKPAAKAASPSASRSKAQLPTPNSPRSQPMPSEPSSPSPPPPAALRPIQRPTRPRPSAKGDSMDLLHDAGSSMPPPEISIPLVAGAKRRHAVMMMFDPTSPDGPGSASTTGGPNPAISGSGSRRRTRTSRSQNQNFSLNQAASDAMDVEEDGRERKRVARR